MLQLFTVFVDWVVIHMQIINFYAIITGVGKQCGKIPTHGHTYPDIVNEMFDFCDWRLFFSKLFVPLKGLSEPQGCVKLKTSWICYLQ